MTLVAYARGSGEIGFCKAPEIPPEGAISFADNLRDFPDLDDLAFQMQVTAQAALGPDGETPVVPGLPEAPPGADTAQIFLDWLDRAFPGAGLMAW